LHARQLLSGQPVTATPDLALNTLSHFLDRFIYKKPKQAKPKGASVMQPAASVNASGAAEGVRRLRGDAADLEGLMNDPKLLKRRVEDVPVDQVFFHKYFVQKKEKERARGGKKAGDESEEEGDEDEESEEETGDEEDGASQGEAPATSDDEEEAEIWKVRS
jgi:ribosome biogenesis protein MAK21